MNCPICQNSMKNLDLAKNPAILWCMNKGDNPHILSSSPGGHWSLTFDKYTVLRASKDGLSVFDNTLISTSTGASQVFIKGEIPLDANIISVVRNYMLLV